MFLKFFSERFFYIYALYRSMQLPDWEKILEAGMAVSVQYIFWELLFIGCPNDVQGWSL